MLKVRIALWVIVIVLIGVWSYLKDQRKPSHPSPASSISFDYDLDFEIDVRLAVASPSSSGSARLRYGAEVREIDDSAERLVLNRKQFVRQARSIGAAAGSTLPTPEELSAELPDLCVPSEEASTPPKVIAIDGPTGTPQFAVFRATLSHGGRLAVWFVCTYRDPYSEQLLALPLRARSGDARAIDMPSLFTETVDTSRVADVTAGKRVETRRAILRLTLADAGRAHALVKRLGASEWLDW